MPVTLLLHRNTSGGALPRCPDRLPLRPVARRGIRRSLLNRGRVSASVPRRKLPSRNLVLWRRHARRWAGPVVLALALAIAAWAIHNELSDIDFDDIVAGFSGLSGWSVALALAFTAASFLALVGYDVSAFRYFRIKAPPARLVLGSFCGYAIANTAGFALLTGASARYRIHAASGMSLFDAGRIALFCALAFGAGVTLIGAVGMLLEPDALVELSRLPESVIRAIGVAMLVSVLGILVFAALERPIRIGRTRFTMPSLPLSLAQLAFCAADIAFAAAAFYVLLPVAGDVSYLEFVAVYCAALAIGILSHVPGGVGVFDAVILAAFAGRTGPAELVAGLLAFRIVYYILPFFLALAIMAFVELHRHRGKARPAHPKLAGMGHATAPALAAGVALLSAAVLLVSGATPAVSDRLDRLALLAPAWLVEAAHLLSAALAGALLYLAFGLLRRLGGAFRASVVCLALGALLAVLKGLALWESIFLAAAAVTLLPFSYAFRRRAGLLDQPVPAAWLAAVALALGATAWLTFFAFQHEALSIDLLAVFAVDAEAPRALRGLAATALTALLFAAAFVMRAPHAPMPNPPTMDDIEAALAIASREGRPEPLLVGLRDKAVRFSEPRHAFVMFGVKERSWIALGDPVGPDGERIELVWRFREAAYAARSRPIFYQASARMAPAYAEVGLDLLRVAEKAVIDLAAFSPDSPGGSDLADLVLRARRQGLRVEFLPPGGLFAARSELAGLSRDWLARRGGRERAFCFGRFDLDYLSRTEIAVLRRGGETVAFANVLAPASGGEAGIDLLRHGAGLPDGALELLVAQLAAALKRRGFSALSLGPTPLLWQVEPVPSRAWTRLTAATVEHGERIWGRGPTRRFKERFAPDWVPVYMALPGDLDPLLALADIEALIESRRPGV